MGVRHLGFLRDRRVKRKQSGKGPYHHQHKSVGTFYSDEGRGVVFPRNAQEKTQGGPGKTQEIQFAPSRKPGDVRIGDENCKENLVQEGEL